MQALSPRIRDLPESERPLERLELHGAGPLATVELLAILVGSGGRGRSALAVAHDVLASSGSLKDLGRMEPGELARLPGVGRSRAARMMAALELGRRALAASEPGAVVESPADAAALLLPHFQGRDREHFGVLILDARNRLVARRTVAIGSLNASLVHPREVFRPAIVLRAARLVLFHNHPSGDPTPSPEDVALTRRLVDLGRTMGIEVLDHVVLGDGRFQSLRDGGAGPIPFGG